MRSLSLRLMCWSKTCLWKMFVDKNILIIIRQDGCVHLLASIVMDFTILFLESVCVGQFRREESFRIIYVFVRSVAFPVDRESRRARFSAESVRLGSSLVPKPSCERISSINNTTLRLSAFQPRSASVFGVGMLLRGAAPSSPLC